MIIERIQIKMDRQKTRALELFKKDSPFGHRVEREKIKYNRKQKHKKLVANLD